MATLISVLATAHAPGQTATPHAPIPEKADSVYAVWSSMGKYLRELRPDVIVGVSNDHFQNFTAMVPPFCVGTAETHLMPDEKFSAQLKLTPRLVEGVPDLADKILEVADREGLPIAFSEQISFMDELSLPLHLLEVGPECRVVPILTNCLHRNRPSAASFFHLGEIVSKAIAELPQELRVVVLCTGGLSHDPTGPNWGLIDEDFDRRFLDLLSHGKSDSLLSEFTLDRMDAAGRGGTPETLNWFAAMGAAGRGNPAEILAYVPVPEWSTGLGYARWALPGAGA